MLIFYLIKLDNYQTNYQKVLKNQIIMEVKNSINSKVILNYFVMEYQLVKVSFKFIISLLLLKVDFHHFSVYVLNQ